MYIYRLKGAKFVVEIIKKYFQEVKIILFGSEENEANLLVQENKGYQLTHPQSRIWYIEKLYPNTSIYNIGGVSRVYGKINFEKLEEAINIFIKKNDGIRLQVTERNGRVFQYINEYSKQNIDFFDFSQMNDPEKEFQVWSDKVIKEPFQLDGGKLYYFAIAKISNNINGIFIKFHHIISDGWSVEIASKSVPDLYEKLIKSEIIDDKPEFSYTEYIESEKQYLQSDRFIKNKDFWCEKYSSLPENIHSVSSDNISGMRAVYNLDDQISEQIRAFTKENRCSLNTFFVATYLIYTYKITGNSDIIIGTPVLNRSGKREKSIFGMFTTTMPCRIKVEPSDSVEDIFKKINSELKVCYFNQKYPYDLFIQDIQLKKQGYDSLFQVCVNYYNTKLYKDIDGNRVENIDLYNGNQLYALEMIIKDWSDKTAISLNFDYKVNDFTQNQIDSLYNSIRCITKQILSNSSQKIDNLDIISENEKLMQIVKFNSTTSDYPSEKTIYQLFQEQVLITPDKAAVSFEGRILSYDELNKKSNQLARLLRNKGVLPDNIIGLAVAHSIEAVIGILAIIKAGAAYLPIDPEYPEDRIEYMLSNSNCKLILTNCISLEKALAAREIIDIRNSQFYSGDDSNLEIVNKPDDLAYVIYTSGSTGKPKGVMIEHRGLVNYIWWAKKMYVRGENDSFALYSSLSFDLTVTSIFTPLISGNSIYVYKDDGQEYVLYKIMKENKVTVIKLTPAHLSLLKELDNRGSSVKRFIVGGEDLKVNLAASIHKSFAGNIEIYNEYGPTETVVGCMIYKYDFVKDNGNSVAIGIPADNVQLYILDKNLGLLPQGCIGELYIAGDGVARGYLNREDLTKERFIENPFIEGKKMYKTSDLAKFLDNGMIEYAGRVDQQVKIRGYRIELGEIEQRLLTFSNITDAVVIDRQNDTEGKYLCAYIVAKIDISISELRKFLSAELPQYMVPLYYVIIDQIPLTQNGKVDRKLLPEPAKIGEEVIEYVPPKNDIEEKLLAAVEKVLDKKKLGMKDNFYFQGGDSIKAIQIASRLNELELKVKVRDIIAHPVLEEMALYIEYGNSNNDDLPCTGSFKPLPIGLWFFERNFENINHYNQSVLLDMKKDISVEELGLILQELIKHHDALRLNYNIKTGELFYNEKYLSENITPKYFDLSGYQKDEQQLKVQYYGEQLKRSLNIENELLIKACIVDLGDQGRRVLITAHHLVVDGVSWRILLEDFSTLYIQLKNKAINKLPPKTNSVIEWTKQLMDYSLKISSDEAEFWKNIMSSDFNFATDYGCGNDCVKSCTTLTEYVDVKTTERLIYNANNAYGTDVNELLITALSRALADTANSNIVMLELEGHGREDIFDEIDISRTIGWFTSIYPAVFNIGNLDISEDVKAVKEHLRHIPNKGLNYGVLNYYTDFLEKKEQKNIRFNFLGDFDGSSQKDIFEIIDGSAGNDCCEENSMTCLIDINAMIINERLKISMTYSRNKFKHDTIEALLRKFITNLKEIIDFCCTKEEKEYTPSDFELLDFSQGDFDNVLSDFD